MVTQPKPDSYYSNAQKNQPVVKQRKDTSSSLSGERQPTSNSSSAMLANYLMTSKQTTKKSSNLLATNKAVGEVYQASGSRNQPSLGGLHNTKSSLNSFNHRSFQSMCIKAAGGLQTKKGTGASQIIDEVVQRLATNQQQSRNLDTGS